MCGGERLGDKVLRMTSAKSLHTMYKSHVSHPIYTVGTEDTVHPTPA